MFGLSSSNVKKLINLGSTALGSSIKGMNIGKFEESGGINNQLLSILEEKNGFYAFESALHVFPLCDAGINLKYWNSRTVWKESYGHLINGPLFCFAEDLFGGQFCICNRTVVRFDPELGEIKPFASDLENWAKIILENYDYETGYPLAHEWQQKNGPLPVNYRLLPKKPFVIGGDFHIENLFAIDAISGMRIRGEVAQKISTLPDGTVVELCYAM